MKHPFIAGVCLFFSIILITSSLLFWGLHFTILNPDFISSQLKERDFYNKTKEMLPETISELTKEENKPQDTEAIKSLTSALDTSWLSQTSDNLLKDIGLWLNGKKDQIILPLSQLKTKVEEGIISEEAKIELDKTLGDSLKDMDLSASFSKAVPLRNVYILLKKIQFVIIFIIAILLGLMVWAATTAKKIIRYLGLAFFIPSATIILTLTAGKILVLVFTRRIIANPKILGYLYQTLSYVVEKNNLKVIENECPLKGGKNHRFVATW